MRRFGRKSIYIERIHGQLRLKLYVKYFTGQRIHVGGHRGNSVPGIAQENFGTHDAGARS